MRVVVDVLVAARTAHVVPHDLPDGASARSWIAALRTGDPLHGEGWAALSRRVREWQRSGEDAGYDVLLRVVEPEPWEDVPAHLADGHLDGDVSPRPRKRRTRAGGCRCGCGRWTTPASC